MNRPDAYAVQLLITPLDNATVYIQMVDAVLVQLKKMLLDVYNLDIPNPQDPLVLSQDMRNFDPATGKFLPPDKEWRYE